MDDPGPDFISPYGTLINIERPGDIMGMAALPSDRISHTSDGRRLASSAGDAVGTVLGLGADAGVRGQNDER
jgi:hypothetical protein